VRFVRIIPHMCLHRRPVIRAAYLSPLFKKGTQEERSVQSGENTVPSDQSANYYARRLYARISLVRCDLVALQSAHARIKCEKLPRWWHRVPTIVPAAGSARSPPYIDAIDGLMGGKLLKIFQKTLLTAVRGVRF